MIPVLAAAKALDWWRIAAYALLVVLVLGAAMGYGYHLGVQQLWDYQVEQAQQTVRVVVKQGKVTEKVRVIYRTRKEKEESEDATVKAQVDTYGKRNPTACLDDEWRGLHDGAATGALPEPGS